ncbi:Methyl-accepting chemotaxis sensory transducer [Hyella patelloides LEGE 07179]|uniref:Methyl-accepting chemotaxis sensory transducer n=1 Tax=Hyella patelloides LEGE 07179 TaxID=945734 RepID=A0A563W0P8_9CYAN|nr:methyl-accepting chemotaxis protein [Hyella patelloides]VEP17269.1 Methyl-accepting chemotaxis sensory transducer [Hyella patelloides LEGE 07179]
MFNKLSLKAKAIVLSSAFGILPVLGSGGLAYYFANKNLYQTKVVEKELSAINLSDKINRFLFERYADIQAVANLPAFNNADVIAAMTTQEKNKLIDKYIELYLIYNSIAVFDLEGDVIAQSAGKPLSNHSDRGYFQEVLKTKQPYMSDVTISKSTGIVAVYFVSPVIDSNTGKMIAIARSRMPISNMDRLGESLEDSSQSWHLVDNASGKIIGASQAETIGKDINSYFPIFTNINQQTVASGIITSQLDNEPELIAYAPFTKLEGLPQIPWGTVVATETATVFAGQKRLAWVIFLGTIITATITTGIAYWLAEYVTSFIRTIANSIAVSSTNIATTVEQQEQTATEQAASVNETTTTVDELGSTSRQSAQQAEVSANGASQALALAEEGEKTVQQTMKGVENLKEKVEEIAVQILNLGEQTAQISQISDSVAKIAKQTNMLALNAAVEAVRAGEHGKGFNVVASEIRKLADESKKSAEKINNLVGEIQAAMNSAIMVTNEGTKTADSSIQLTKETATSFLGVKDAVNNVFLNTQQISLSSKQQAVAIQQILSAIGEINLGAKETAQGITKVRSTTQDLTSVAEQLKTSVN